MYRHFAYIHPEVEVVIHDKTLERCKLCEMFTPDADRYGRSQTCKKLQGRRANIEAASIQSAADDVTFTIKGEEIERVEEFRYLGRILDENDNDRKCILAQLKKAR